MITETFHTGTTDPVSIDCHAAPCALCRGRGRVVWEAEPGEGRWLVPADYADAGQMACPDCRSEDDR